MSSPSPSGGATGSGYGTLAPPGGGGASSSFAYPAGSVGSGTSWGGPSGIGVVGSVSGSLDELFARYGELQRQHSRATRERDTLRQQVRVFFFFFFFFPEWGVDFEHCASSRSERWLWLALRRRL